MSLFFILEKGTTCLDNTHFVGYFCLYFIYCVNQGDVNEEDEKLFESFFVKNALPRRTLAYILIKKIKDNDAELAEGLMIMHIYISCLFFDYCILFGYLCLIVNIVSFF